MMRKKGMGASEIIVGLIILVVIGIGVAGSLISSNSAYAAVTNESVTVPTGNSMGHNGTVTLANQYLKTWKLSNNTKTLVENTDYIVSDATGAQIRIVTNYSTAQSKLNATYTYRQSGYIDSGTARTVAALIVVFLAIAALMFVAKEVGFGQ